MHQRRLLHSLSPTHFPLCARQQSGKIARKVLFSLAGAALVLVIITVIFADKPSSLDSTAGSDRLTASTRASSPTVQSTPAMQPSPQQREISTPLAGADNLPGDELFPAVAPSLRGSEVDADFHFDGNGQLINDLALRHYFDYFLSTIGELSIEEIRQALAQDLAQRLDPAQADQASRVLERYLEYLAAAEELSVGGDVAERFAQLVELRRRILGDDLADGFFGQEENYTRTVLSEQDIIKNHQLSLEQRQQQLQELHQNLPAELRQSREEAIAHHLVLEQQQQFEQLQLDPAQRHAERAALFGEEAAQRLAALDQQRQLWQQRLDAYQQQRSALLAQGVDEAAINALRAELFDETELRRVQALEEIGFPDTDQDG